MKNRVTLLFVILLLLEICSGCGFIGDILEMGIWIGVIIVVAVLLIIIAIIRKLKRF